MNQFLEETDSGLKITPKGKEYLDKATTDAEGNVYAFTGKGLSATTTAAAMARLSRSPHDMRVTILKEFAEEGKDEQLLRRVITMYGDDSVQQLVGIHIAVEGASNLLTKYIEWGRLAAYLEQSTRYIFYDEKDEAGEYRYFTPELPKPLTSLYKTETDKIFDGYSDIVHKLYEYISRESDTPESERDAAWRSAVRAQACDAARPLLPVATKSTVGIFASSQAIENMVMRLRAHPNKEARDCGESILREVRKVIPAFFDRADKPERGGGTSAYLSETKQTVSDIIAEVLKEEAPVSQSMGSTLVNVYPENEMELVADMVYDMTNTSLEHLRAQISLLSESDKLRIFDSYFGTRLNRRHRPGRALENAHYTYDIVCDYGIFRDLQRHRLVNDLRWQSLTPSLGYDVPELVTKARLSSEFNDVFARSSALFKTLLEATNHETAQYATLLGHNMRWRISFNAREAIHFLELRTAPQGHPGYRKLSKMMYDQLAEAHPNIAKHLIFINQDEDPALTRLAAERASQLKLDALDE